MGNLTSSLMKNLVFQPPTPSSYQISNLVETNEIRPMHYTEGALQQGCVPTVSACVTTPPMSPKHTPFTTRQSSSNSSPKKTNLGSFRLPSYSLQKTKTSSPFVTKYSDQIIIVKSPTGGHIVSLFFSNPKSRGITLIYSHGNAEDLGQLADMLKELSKCLCVNVVAYDYRGYGESKFESEEEDGAKKKNNSTSDFRCETPSDASASKRTFQTSPTEASVNADLETIYAYYCLEKKISPANVFLYGRSLGTAPSTHLASILTSSNRSSCIAKLSGENMVKLFEGVRKGMGVSSTSVGSSSSTSSYSSPSNPSKTPMLGGLILQSPMKSCLKTKFDLGVDFTSPTSDCSSASLDMFATQNYITSVECPIFIIHGSNDTIVPCKHGKYLFELSKTFRDLRWKMREKRKAVHTKEEGVMVWLLETKLRRREEKILKQQKNAWKIAGNNNQTTGVRYADDSTSGQKPKSPPGRLRSKSAPVSTRSTSLLPVSTCPPPLGLYVVKGAGHNDVQKVAGLELVREVRGFLIEVLRYRYPEWQRPLMTSPNLIRIREDDVRDVVGDIISEEEDEEEVEEEESYSSDYASSDDSDSVVQPHAQEVFAPPPSVKAPETSPKLNVTTSKSFANKKIRTPLRSLQNLQN